MIAKRSGAENFQDSKSADKIQNGIKQGNINEFRALHDKAMKRNPQNDQSTNRIDRQNTVKRGWPSAVRTSAITRQTAQAVIATIIIICQISPNVLIWPLQGRNCVDPYHRFAHRHQIVDEAREPKTGLGLFWLRRYQQ